MPQWSEPIRHPSAWTRADLERDRAWIHELDEADVAELEAAVKDLRERGVRAEAIDRKTMPLPRLASRLRRVFDDVEHGRGVALLRGVPVERHDVDAITMMYLGIGAHLGERITQTAEGAIVGHVSDMGYKYGEQNVRGYYTRAKLLFHTDNADHVGLLCIRKAKSGGESSITSTMSIFNEFLANRPDLLEQCFEGYYHDLKGENPPGVPPVTPHRVPIFSYFDGHLSSCFNTSYIEHGAKRRGVELTARERETLDYFNELASRKDLRYDFLMEPGDIQLINDHTTVHSRTEFDDHDEPSRKRLLLRLWLRVPDGRPMAPEIADRGYGPGSARHGVPPFRAQGDLDRLSLRVS